MVPATDYCCMLPAFGVSLRQVAARFVALAPHGMGRALAPVGALPPYLPRGFYSPFSTYIERTHIRERRDNREYRERKQLLQLGKNISPTRKIEKHTPANIANPANLANTKTWYGEGIERVRSGAISHPSGFFLDER